MSNDTTPQIKPQPAPIPVGGALSSSMVHKRTSQQYGEYLFGKSFDDPNAPSDGKPNWNSHTLGRVLIRLFSRGIMGATLYTVGVAAVRKQFNPDLLPLNQLGSFAQYPLRYVARGIDKVVGTPIKAYAKWISPAERAEELAHKAVWFRDTAYFGYSDASGLIKGRGLGHEATAMTFDFAMGSIGDAWGRRIADLADPNIDNEWYKDGKFDVKRFGKDVANAAWTIISKNQGEDWAAAIPYVYQMRWQRQAINKLWPGFVYTSDRSLNGGSWLMDKDGKITNSFSAAGALDLQFRFTGYNWYTLMFRDGYDALANTLHNWQQGKPPTITLPQHPIEGTIEGIATATRYVLKSAIKAGIYMMPAVPFFWAFRTPQTKYKGVGIHLDPATGEGVLATTLNEQGRPVPYYYYEGTLTRHTPVQASQITLGANGPALTHGDFGAHFNPYDAQHARGWFDKAVRPFGVASNAYAKFMDRNLTRFGMNFSKNAVYDWANASISYTPYMIAKAETALRWSHEGMDHAINTFIDGVFGLNLGKVKAGLHDIREEIAAPLRSEKKEPPKTLLVPVPQQIPTPAPEKPSNTLASGNENRSLAERFAQERTPPPGASIH